MTGLLMKDIYTLFKQMGLYLLLIVIFTLMPGDTMPMFAIIYAALLPITALAYDERSKWDTLAAMMPYKKSDLVLSKYLLGYLGIVISCLFATAAQAVTAAFGGAAFTIERVCSTLLVACVAALLLAFNLPFMFKLGVEKGRIFFYVLVGLAAVGGALLSQSSVPTILDFGGDLTTFTVIGLIGSVLLSALSAWISVKLYAGKTV